MKKYDKEQAFNFEPELTSIVCKNPIGSQGHKKKFMELLFKEGEKRIVDKRLRYRHKKIALYKEMTNISVPF